MERTSMDTLLWPWQQSPDMRRWWRQGNLASQLILLDLTWVWGHEWGLSLQRRGWTRTSRWGLSLIEDALIWVGLKITVGPLKCVIFLLVWQVFQHIFRSFILRRSTSLRLRLCSFHPFYSSHISPEGECKHPIPVAFGMSWSTKLGPLEVLGKILWQPLARNLRGQRHPWQQVPYLNPIPNSGVWCSYVFMACLYDSEVKMETTQGSQKVKTYQLHPNGGQRLWLVRSPKCVESLPLNTTWEVVCPRNPREKESCGCCYWHLHTFAYICPVWLETAAECLGNVTGFLPINFDKLKCEWLTVFRHTLGGISSSKDFPRGAWHLDHLALDVPNFGEAIQHSDMGILGGWDEQRTFATFPK